MSDQSINPEALATVRASLEEGLTLPAGWYSEPEVFRLEQERIFRRAWHYAGHVSRVSSAGEYLTLEAGGVPVVVVRGSDGRLRAFVNVCRHRGNLLVEGQGRCSTLQCAYHAWTYDLDGRLRGAPRSERETGFDRAELGLVPVAVEQWEGFVFVNLLPDPPELRSVLGDVPELLSKNGVDLAGLQLWDRTEAEMDANWKVAVENFLECYHCPVVHPEFSRMIDMQPDPQHPDSPWAFTLRGALTSAAEKPGASTPYDLAGPVMENQSHLVWPSFTLNVLPGPLNLLAVSFVPIDTTTTLYRTDYYFPPDLHQDVVRDMVAFGERVGVEDRDIVTTVQRGTASGGIQHGKLLMESEHQIHRFQTMVVENLSC